MSLSENNFQSTDELNATFAERIVNILSAKMVAPVSLYLVVAHPKLYLTRCPMLILIGQRSISALQMSGGSVLTTTPVTRKWFAESC